MNPIAEDILMHYGVKKRSGRYPWGSGEEPFQRSGDFISRIEELRKAGRTEKQIADELGLSTTDLRAYKMIAKNERRMLEVETAKGLREKGYSLNEIAEKMGYNNDSSVRALLNDDAASRMKKARETADFLKKQIDEKGMIAVGAGVELELGMKREKFEQALAILEAEGYPVYGGGIQQLTNPGKQTIMKVICPPGTEYKEIYNLENINSLKEYVSHDGGDTFDRLVYPKSMDGKRVMIRYAEEGGLEKDGLVEIRRNVDDLSLGNSRYAQVRILVDDNRYIKGMAVYSDNLPDGVDIIVNSNKKLGTPKDVCLKEIKDDPDNPFGSLIKAGGQSYYIDKDGNRQLSCINKRAEEGDWNEWSKTLPSQFLSKQPMQLINKQLGLALADKEAEYDEICSLTNPTVKKALLKSFADDCDATAVSLDAAALPGQKYKVILPISSMKETEVYAPDFDDGSSLALVRYPHAGTFEIPILKVNNKQTEAKKLLGNGVDVVGINSKVAERLSGADFDGDTVMCIPTGGKVKITSTSKLKALEGFDTKSAYGPDEEITDKNGEKHYYRNGKEYRILKSKAREQNEMGSVSNLIADMTLKGANPETEISRAVKHSMVVIDAKKHHLDYKQSEIDNDIAGLKAKYQGHYDLDGNYSKGASTLITQAGADTRVKKRVGSQQIDKATGKAWYKEVDETYVDKKGKTQTRTITVPRMSVVDDARVLSSGKKQEEAYADYANRLKSMANRARKTMVNTADQRYKPSAKVAYAKEVSSLDAQLKLAKLNAPRERYAQIKASVVVKAKVEANPDLTNAEKKKIKQQALTAARVETGAHRTKIVIKDREWEAIQAGAISASKLAQIIANADPDDVRQRATPRATTTISTAKKDRIKSMNISGYTIEQIAKACGVSVSSVSRTIKGKE